MEKKRLDARFVNFITNASALLQENLDLEKENKELRKKCAYLWHEIVGSDEPNEFSDEEISMMEWENEWDQLRDFGLNPADYSLKNWDVEVEAALSEAEAKAALSEQATTSES